MHRFEIEDMIEEILIKNRIGEGTGGGTSFRANVGILDCNIEFNIEKVNI